jgi:chromosome partitioning protein
MSDTDPRAGERAPEASAENKGHHPRKATPWNTLSARVISLVSRKGGVGKTTSTVNLGAAFALSGHSVLIVGVDPQCGVSRTLGYGKEELTSDLREIFTRGTPLTHLAQTTPIASLFFVSPSIWSLTDEDEFLRQMESRVDTFVHEIDRARNLYDTILIDCPPGLSATTRAALLASDSYLIPVQAEELCRDSLGRLLDFIESFRSQAYAASDLAVGEDDPPLSLEGMFLTMVNGRTRMSRHVTDRVTRDHGAHLFRAAIPRTTRLTEMALRGKPAVIYDRRSAGSRAYFDLADEMLLHWLHNGGGAGQEAAAAGDATRVAAAPAPPAPPAPSPAGGARERGAEDADPPPPGDSLARLWREIQSRQAANEDAETGIHDSAGPEMISLDDILAEEESRANEESEWDDATWNDSSDYPRRFN